ncbi:MAG: hypothetical protein IPJ34_29970 [Myxococcales bacterium]|nr:hypothetical protein [Myxococcales bacterium]
MANDPYQAPTAASAPQADASLKARLRPIAVSQRWVNLMVLASLIAFLAIFLLGIGDPLRLIVFAALGVLSAAAVTQLAYRVYESAVAAVLAAIGCLVPYVSLVVMVVVNQSATKMVKAAGYQVGLLGADPKQFD